MELLALSETDAQVLVDLLQTLLDHDAFLMIRPSLFNALLQLCRAYRLFPTCFALSGLQLDRYPIAIRGLGDVGKGWVCGQSVAVKMTKTFIYEDFSIEPFGNEVLIWRQLCHPNILPFFGLSYRYSRRCLVLPWMKNGAIWGHLRDDSPGIDARISLILGVALGVEYLHRNGVVHANLKGSNILVTPSHRACIIDFGSSSMVDARIRGSSPSQGGAMPLRWQAPELLKGANSNLGSDVYAFGCVCYEVLTGHIPFYDLRHDGVVIMAVARGRRPTRLQSCTGTPVLDNLWDLIQDCWEQNPDKRPTASQIVERLVGPLIQATTTQSTTDWDKKLTARFRRSLQAQTLQPAINEIARELLGDGVFDETSMQLHI
ncbi:kinase-like domain-containing protein [Mycena galopus ATCC 62051]|nr:kinase-like domain-containing protein [Mycena galopus ATCC 62051]